MISLDKETKFDAMAAMYVYCMDYHEGQWSRLYRILCRLGRHIHLTDNAINQIRDGGEEWDIAHEYYKSLVDKRII